MIPKILISLSAIFLFTSAIANTGGGGGTGSSGPFVMSPNVSFQVSGTITQCVAGLIVNPIIVGQTTWSLTGSGSTETNRPSSYMAVFVRLFQLNSAVIDGSQSIAPSGPISSVSASVRNNRQCFSEPLYSGWKIISTHKARPMPSDPDASKGDQYIEDKITYRY